jgi:diamine N-acetyltransferase
MRLRATTPADLDFVMAAEADADTAPLMVPWPRDLHARVIEDRNQEHKIFESRAGGRWEPLGYVVLAGLGGRHRSVELRRIVSVPKGRGVGGRALALVAEHAFRELGAHRLWLDVMVHNQRAQHAYERAGFVREGVMRDALLTEAGYVSLVLMSLLAPEWAGSRSPPPRGTDR